MTREVKDIMTISYFRPFKDMIDVDVDLEKLFHSVNNNPDIGCCVRDTATGREIAIGSYTFCRSVYHSMKDAGHLSLEVDVVKLIKENIIADDVFLPALKDDEEFICVTRTLALTENHHLWTLYDISRDTARPILIITDPPRYTNTLSEQQIDNIKYVMTGQGFIEAVDDLMSARDQNKSSDEHNKTVLSVLRYFRNI